MSFKVAPGVRIRASSRGISAGVGPRAARVHVGARGVGVSSGVGPFSTYSHLGGGGGRTSTSAGSRSTYRGPTKASVAAHERELRAAERQADIEKVAAIEKALVSVHTQSFPKAARVELPPAEEVDPTPIPVSPTVAPGTQVVQLLVIRREVDGKRSGGLAAVYLGEFDRAHYEAASGSRDPAEALTRAPEAVLKLKGRAGEVAPIDLSDQDGLVKVLDQVADRLNS